MPHIIHKVYIKCCREAAIIKKNGIFFVENFLKIYPKGGPFEKKKKKTWSKTA